tara:strand:- start:2389 stop:2790 length:402 start_codon:yes stop_codon:yes gene_type:complete
MKTKLPKRKGVAKNKIMKELSESSKNIYEIARKLNMDYRSVYRHIHELRERRIVTIRKDGKRKMVTLRPEFQELFKKMHKDSILFFLESEGRNINMIDNKRYLKNLFLMKRLGFLDEFNVRLSKKGKDALDIF